MEKSNNWPQERVPIALVGPTAVGKTAVAVALAEQLDAEIINADSMQVYRGMDIGTAKPTPEERERARFHLIDVVAPDQPYNVSEWKTGAEAALAEITARGRRAIVCGGTGMYARALFDDWNLAQTPADPALRARLQAESEQLGSESLHARLREIDPVTAARLHVNDAVRIIRALEVYYRTGEPISLHQARNQAESPARPALHWGLTLPRERLCTRIEARVDAMLESGFENEVRRLLDQGYARTSGPMLSLGYKEMTAYLHGETDFARASADIKQNTRRFAKRQLTWFRADARIVWFDVSGRNSAEVANLLAQLT